jgi:hypothetical protein
MKGHQPTGILVVDDEVDQSVSRSQKPMAACPRAPVDRTMAITPTLRGFDATNQPLIAGVPGLPLDPVAARTTVPLSPEDVGSTLVVVFDGGELDRPIIVGVLREHSSPRRSGDNLRGSVSVFADDERVVLSADQEIVLRCGEASITLTRAGKVLIKGAYVSTRSSGVNRIKGGSVQIN